MIRHVAFGVISSSYAINIIYSIEQVSFEIETRDQSFEEESKN